MNILNAASIFYHFGPFRNQQATLLFILFFLNNSIALFLPIGLGKVDKEIAKNDDMKITAEEVGEYDYSLPLAEFIKKYTETVQPKSKELNKQN